MPSNHDKLIAFLRTPPGRIGVSAVKKRKSKGVRSYPGGWKGLLFKRQKGLCKYCRSAMSKGEGPYEATIDHVVPISRGGRNSRDNVVLACRSCNQAKGAMSVEEFRKLQSEGAEA